MGRKRKSTINSHLLNETNGKVILIDFGLFLHRAVFGWNASLQKSKTNKNILVLPATYLALSMLIASLNKIGVDIDDEVIVAIDGKNNWRKEVDSQYKANRAGLRKKSGIDWYKKYGEFNDFLDTLNMATPFHFIKIDRLEADDIIALACQYYKDKEKIIVSSDSDFEQLVVYPNVKLFSPVTKKYKIIDNPYQVLEKKIKKEYADNLTSEIKTRADYNRRKLLVNLMTLPKDITKVGIEALKNIKEKTEYEIDLIPYNSLKERFFTIYNPDKIVSYEKCHKQQVRKKQKEKVKRRKRYVRDGKGSSNHKKR